MKETKWPDKTLRIIVPYPPGGSSDIIARAISQPLSDALKQTVIVENKAGADGSVGAEFVAKAALGRRGAGTRQWTDLKPDEIAQLADLIAKVGGQ